MNGIEEGIEGGDGWDASGAVGNEDKFELHEGKRRVRGHSIKERSYERFPPGCEKPAGRAGKDRFRIWKRERKGAMAREGVWVWFV